MKIRYIGIPLVIGLVIFGLIYVKQRMKEETNRLRAQREMQGISVDGRVVQDVEQISLISSKGIFSTDITAQDVFDLGAFLEGNEQSIVSSYVEAYYRVSKSLNIQCEYYEITATKITLEEIINNEPGTYVEVIYSNPHTFRFANKPDWILEETRHFLFRVEDGSFWYGSEKDGFSQYAAYSNGERSYQIDSDFISLVEGEIN